MVLNLDKCHFMVLDDPNYNWNLTCIVTTIKCSKEENVLGVTIDNNLTFTSHLGNTIKKEIQKFHALSRVKDHISFEINKLIMPSFIKSQLN